MAFKASETLLRSLCKVPLFAGLTLSQMKSLIQQCANRSLANGQPLCQSGEASDELYVLIAGSLGVTAPGGTRVATLYPVTTVGEMGVITGQTRSATVAADQASVVLTLGKRRFEQLLKSDPRLQGTVYRNIISSLAEKVSGDNERIHTNKLSSGHHGRWLAAYECLVAEQHQRFELAVELAAEQGGRSAEELRRMIEARIERQAIRVLLVDDDRQLCQRLTRLLSFCAVRQTQNAAQALAMVGAEVPDLVIAGLDIMQDRQGQLCEALRREFPQVALLAAARRRQLEAGRQWNSVPLIDREAGRDEWQRQVVDVLDFRQDSIGGPC